MSARPEPAKECSSEAYLVRVGRGEVDPARVAEAKAAL